MDNPLLEPRPDGLVDQVRAYARDIAYLIVCGKIGSKISEISGRVGSPLPKSRKPDQSANETEFQQKWGVGDSHNAPSLDLLVTFRYLQRESEQISDDYIISARSPRYTVYYLVPTEKAFSLLEQPITPPKIFISYRHAESSAFALLIEARLRRVETGGIFIDKDIRAGEDWHEEVTAKIEKCDSFIVLIGPTTLESDAIQKEIACAVRLKRNIYPIWHNGFTKGKIYPAAIDRIDAISVSVESARDYETAISRLLNAMDYPTF
jgi:hypothetical protein